MPRAGQKQTEKPQEKPNEKPQEKPNELTITDQILQSIHDMNMNPYLLGIAYITLNLGSRFFVMSVSPGQEAFLQNVLFRPLLLFAIMFLGTRNLIVAFWLTTIVIVLLHYLLNETSSWYLLKDWHA